MNELVSAHRDSMSGNGLRTLRRCVVVGGSGAVGAMFADRLAHSGTRVCVVDRAPGGSGARFVRGDITAIDDRLAAELGAADLVLLAVPEPVALAAVGPVAAALRPGAVLADTLSVKGRIVAALRTGFPSVEAVSLNPMFAPALGFASRPVVAVMVRDGQGAREVLGLIESWGGRVVRMSADEHDRMAGASQALTHAAVLAFGLGLAELGVDFAALDAVAPPPHSTLLALLARITGGTPEVYWDVQAANPHAARSRRALADGLGRIARLADDADEAGFTAALAELRGLFGADLDRHRATCARVFEAINHGGEA
jgi:4-amino-4-deoxyprephenate dehydrogenase